MIPRELVGIAEVPGGAPLSLYRRGADYMISLGRNELMSSRMSGSEVALATMALERLGQPPAPRILIGGYGMGFTLRAALGAVGDKAEIIVSEIVSEVIDWAVGPMAEMTGDCLVDPRVTLRMGDVAREIDDAAEGRDARYDAILLDVDNGPDGLSRDFNNGLYNRPGLARAKAALNPGGILAIWSAAADEPFTRKLADAGFTVDAVRVRARENGKGPIHMIWFATIR
ncbi:MAG: spermidine synthase [Sphingomicrobium sp.]